MGKVLTSCLGHGHTFILLIPLMIIISGGRTKNCFTTINNSINACLVRDWDIYAIRPNKKICVFRATVSKKLGRVGIDFFFYIFF